MSFVGLKLAKEKNFLSTSFAQARCLNTLQKTITYPMLESCDGLRLHYAKKKMVPPYGHLVGTPSRTFISSSHSPSVPLGGIFSSNCARPVAALRDICAAPKSERHPLPLRFRLLQGDECSGDALPKPQRRVVSANFHILITVLI